MEFPENSGLFELVSWFFLTPLVTWGFIPLWCGEMTFLGRHLFVGWDWKDRYGKMGWRWDEVLRERLAFKKGGAQVIFLFWTSVDTAFLDRNKNIQTSQKPNQNPAGLKQLITFFATSKPWLHWPPWGISYWGYNRQNFAFDQDQRFNRTLASRHRWEMRASPHPVHCGWGDCLTANKKPWNITR